LWLSWPAGLAHAQRPLAATEESTATGTVDRVDRSSRVITFRRGSSELRSVFVDPAVGSMFDTLQAGDVVSVRYVESVIVQVHPAAASAGLRDTGRVASETAVDVPQQLTEDGTIESVDPWGLQVTYRTSDYRRVVRVVTDRRLLDGVRPGERVEVTLTRPRAVRIERGRR
jgi:hypothetical protein